MRLLRLQHKDRHRPGQPASLTLECCGSCSRLLNKCGILLRHLVKQADGLVDLRYARRLVSGCGVNLTHPRAHTFDRSHNFGHGPSGVISQLPSL